MEPHCATCRLPWSQCICPEEDDEEDDELEIPQREQDDDYGD